jgi:hypothetical protein
MEKDQKDAFVPFGQLVKAKLKEKHMSQAELGRRILRGTAYMSYLLRGTTRNFKGKKFRAQPDVVLEIAKVLQIPPDDALLSAGLDPALVRRNEPPEDMRPAPPKPALPAPAPNKPDQALFDLAVKAALEALKGHAAVETTTAPATGAKWITIDLAGGAQIILTGAGDLTAEEIERLAQGFRDAYSSVRDPSQNREQ